MAGPRRDRAGPGADPLAHRPHRAVEPAAAGATKASGKMRIAAAAAASMIFIDAPLAFFGSSITLTQLSDSVRVIQHRAFQRVKGSCARDGEKFAGRPLFVPLSARPRQPHSLWRHRQCARFWRLFRLRSWAWPFVLPRHRRRVGRLFAAVNATIAWTHNLHVLVNTFSIQPNN
jgi:hypothetical protein